MDRGRLDPRPGALVVRPGPGGHRRRACLVRLRGRREGHGRGQRRGLPGSGHRRPGRLLRRPGGAGGSTLVTPGQTTRSGNDVVAWFGTQAEVGAGCAASSLTHPAAFREVQESCVPANGDGLRYASAIGQVGAAAARPGWRGTSNLAADHVSEAVALRPAGPAIGQRGTTSATVDGRALTLDLPPRTEAGDVLLASVAGRNHVGEAVEAPPGWTLVREDHSSYQISSAVYVHTVLAEDPASWTFRVGSSQTLTGSISGYTGVDPARPVDVSAGRINGATTLLTAPALTTEADHDQAVWLGTQALNVGSCPSVLLTAPTSFTERASRCVSTLGRGLLVTVADAPLGAQGAERGLDGVASGAGTNATQLVALRAAEPVSVADAYLAASVDVGKLWRADEGGPAPICQPTCWTSRRASPSAGSTTRWRTCTARRATTAWWR